MAVYICCYCECFFFGRTCAECKVFYLRTISSDSYTIQNSISSETRLIICLSICSGHAHTIDLCQLYGALGGGARLPAGARATATAAPIAAWPGQAGGEARLLRWAGLLWGLGPVCLPGDAALVAGGDKHQVLFLLDTPALRSAAHGVVLPEYDGGVCQGEGQARVRQFASSDGHNERPSGHRLDARPQPEHREAAWHGQQSEEAAAAFHRWPRGFRWALRPRNCSWLRIGLSPRLDLRNENGTDGCGESQV